MRPSSPLRSPAFLVSSGRSSARAVAAIIRSATARKTARSQDCTGNQPVGARSLDPERNRLDEGLDQLESRLPTGALHRIRCASRSGTQLGECHDADGELLGKQGRVDLRQVNDDRRIEKADSVRLRHGAQDPDR